MPTRVFIDGEAGTTGLQIRERLEGRDAFELIRLGEAERKDARARAEALNAADVAILCLPDAAAREAVSLIRSDRVRVIDASTAHRTAAAWEYGLPELAPGQRERLRAATRVANPGCYATAAIALLRPLVDAGLVPADWPVSLNAVSGYSGGGRAMIEEFEGRATGAQAPPPFRLYALRLAHKHLPEITLRAGLERPPGFAPAVGRYHSGMILELPLPLWALPGRPSLGAVRDALAARYEGERFVEVASASDCERVETLEPEALNGTNRLKLYVFGDEPAGQARLAAVLDNLGKGASGAAVQNLNLLSGRPEGEGLE